MEPPFAISRLSLLYPNLVFLSRGGDDIHAGARHGNGRGDATVNAAARCGKHVHLAGRLGQVNRPVLRIHAERGGGQGGFIGKPWEYKCCCCYSGFLPVFYRNCLDCHRATLYLYWYLVLLRKFRRFASISRIKNCRIRCRCTQSNFRLHRTSRTSIWLYYRHRYRTTVYQMKICERTTLINTISRISIRNGSLLKFQHIAGQGTTIPILRFFNIKSHQCMQI